MSTNQAWTWYQRRNTSGFPEAKDHKAKAGGPRFDREEVMTWHKGYRPWQSLVGRPTRNPRGRAGKKPKEGK